MSAPESKEQLFPLASERAHKHTARGGFGSGYSGARGARLAVAEPEGSDDSAPSLNEAPRALLRESARRLRHIHADAPDISGLSMEQVGAALKETMAVIFPHYSQGFLSEAELFDRLAAIRGLWCVLFSLAEKGSPEFDGPARAEEWSDRLIEALPEITATCMLDAKALTVGDPAAETLEEVILSYPGFYATAAYRIAHHLFGLAVPVIPRLITEFAHQKTGIDIHPQAQIGHSFFIDHGTGVVIGGTATIGNNVRLYQGVTLGALKVSEETASDVKRHPTIEDYVVIYANATILGGGTVIGNGSVIGGNVWITKSVPPGSRVMFKSCDTEYGSN